MKNLVERILQVREEIDKLERQKNGLSNQISKKKEMLTELEKLTVNQLDIFTDGKED